VLLYIGKAARQTFAQRIPEEKWNQGTEDTSHTEIYVGRLKGPSRPSRDEWLFEIDPVEKLLIHPHGPAYNSTNIMGIAENGTPDVCNTRVLNWGCHRDIQPEVSGLRWTRAATEQAKTFGVYEAPVPH
jgi:hypothetical protein